MNYFWIYDIPTWQLAVGSLSGFSLLSIAIVYFIRNRSLRTFNSSSVDNEMVSSIFSGVGLLFGLVMGLVAITAWENFDRSGDIVSSEAATAGALYREISALRSPEKQRMLAELEEYLKEVIQVAWSLHHKGRPDSEDGHILSRLHAELTAYGPRQGADKDLYREALRTFSKLTGARDLRLEEVSTGIPVLFWTLIMIGALLTLSLIGFFHVRSLKLHLLVSGVYGFFMGGMVFLLAAMDSPLSGEVSISPEPYQAVLSDLRELDPDSGGRCRKIIEGRPH